jgi:hypothetical protein
MIEMTGDEDQFGKKGADSVRIPYFSEQVPIEGVVTARWKEKVLV